MVAISGRLTRRVVFMTIFWFGLAGKLRAKTTTEILCNYLDQNGNSGRQVYDGSGSENMTLYEPMVFIGTDIGEDTHLAVTALYDTWTSASAQIFDHATGASSKSYDGTSLASQPSSSTPPPTPSSGTTANVSDPGTVPFEHRQALHASLSQKWGSWQFTPQVGISSQVNYNSTAGGLTVAKNLAQDNFTLALSYDLARDSSLFYNLASSKFTGWLPKNTDSYEISGTQLLGPRSVILVGAGTATQQGFLATTRNTVTVAGQRMQEILPAARHRQFYTLRYAYALADFLALHTDYRYYTDDWGITAHTIEPFLAFSFAEDDGLVRLGYRLHQQNAATYYASERSAPQVYMTSDSDLAAFTAQEVSLLGSYTIDTPGTLFTTMQLGAGAVSYQRDNGLAITVLQASVGATL